MELRHLRYFVAVAEERHFGRAAQRLHMAQPPLSQQIRQLEAELGVTLLRRTTRRVDLTEAGEAYLARARSVLDEVDEAAAEATRIASGLQGRLVVGCVGSATYSLLPALAKSLREELPGIDFAFRGEMLVPDLVAALRQKTIDLALLRPWGESTPDDLSMSVLRAERFIVALPEDHPLANRTRLRPTDLRGHDLVVHSGPGRSVTYDAVSRMCHEAGFEARFRHQVGETSTLLTFVAAGLGIAVVPEPVAQLGVIGTVFRPLTSKMRTELASAVRVDESPALHRALEVLARLVGR